VRSFNFSPIDKALRKGILAGAAVCVATVAYSVVRYPGVLGSAAAPKFLPLFLIAIIWYVFAALRWTHVAKDEDFVVLNYGARWGLVIGLAWIVEAFAGDVLMPHSPVGMLATMVAAALPAVAGATGAAVTGQTSTGVRIGFWSGVVSGLIAFVGVAGVGYLSVDFPEFLQSQDSSSEIASAIATGQLAGDDIGDYLARGVSQLLLAGALFCSAAGAFGGLFGRVARGHQATLNH
jgi:hypothetical protein